MGWTSLAQSILYKHFTSIYMASLIPRTLLFFTWGGNIEPVCACARVFGSVILSVNSSAILKSIGKRSLLLKAEQKKSVSRSLAAYKSICYECLPFLYDYKCSYCMCLKDLIIIRYRGKDLEKYCNCCITLNFIDDSVIEDTGSKCSNYEQLFWWKNWEELIGRSLESCSSSLLFAAPEALIDVQGWMLSPPLCDQLVAIAVDEAHCVSKW